MGLQLPSPADPMQEWLDADYDREAERVIFAMHGRPKREQYVQPPWAPRDMVRPNWRQIRANDLTDAERAIAERERKILVSRFHAAVGEMAEKAKALSPRGWAPPAAERIDGDKYDRKMAAE